MAAGDITYGTPTSLGDTSRLHSLADANAVAFGEIQAAGEISLNIRLTIGINSSATEGTYDIYVVESNDGSEWTDNIDPATSGDVSDKIADAVLVHQSDTIYDATDRTEAVIHFNLDMYGLSEYVGLVVHNKSNQTTPATGADGEYTTLKVS